jgi:MerR family transcriptional regulator, thiopeptide resistance regulator
VRLHHRVEVTTTGYSVGEVSRLAGVTVRTLHHYDDVGLLRPSGRTASGYRLYATGDLDRLQRVLCYRELGFGLEEITAILDDPAVDPMDHLRRQHGLLTERMEQLRRMVAAIEKTMEARKMGIELDPQELFEVFGDADPTVHHEEAERRWSETDAWRESRSRTASYTKDDWKRITGDQRRIQEGLAAALAAGQPADGVAAMDLAEEHRRHIERWFYPCDHAMHRGLGDMYVADPRFAVNYEQLAPGLAAYVRDAVHANASRHESR